MNITGWMRRLSLVGIDAIWQLSLGCLLMRTTASFLRYTGYLNFINGPINRVFLLILVHVQLLRCLFFWPRWLRLLSVLRRWFCCCWLFCLSLLLLWESVIVLCFCTLLYVHSSIALILIGKRELVALLDLSSWWLVMVERLFLAVPRGCLRFVIVVFPDHTH